MNTLTAQALAAASIAALLCACSQDKPPADALRPVRTVQIRYSGAGDAHRYFGAVQSRHEVEHAFRVGGKVVQRRVEVGRSVREGDVLAVLDAADYRLAEEAAQQQLVAATTQARQAESDQRRLEALAADGSVSVSDDEHARSRARQAKAAAAAEARKLELARNRVEYTVLRASRSGVVTALRAEVGQVVAEGQPVATIANPGEPEIVVDVPEDHLAAFRAGRFKAALSAAPGETFAVALRELSPQAMAVTRTYRARLKPVVPRAMPLGATATLLAERADANAALAAIPAGALTQGGAEPAVWAVRHDAAGKAATVELTPVKVHGYRNDEALVSGPPPGTLVVTAGVHKMAPGLRVALPTPAVAETASKVAAQ